MALHVYIYDGHAFELSHAQVTEDIFADLFPDVRYKLVAIDHKSPQLTEDLRSQLKEILADDEQIEFLVIDTHGSTIKDSDDPALGIGTHLTKLGKVYENGVDTDFAVSFEFLKNRGTKDMKILLNSCSVFCEGKESAAKRGQRLLEFFDAPEGSIYGADVPEISYAYDHWRYLRPEYLRPPWAVALSAIVIGSVAGVFSTPLDFFDSSTYWDTAKTTTLFGSTLFAGFSMFRPTYQWLMSKFKLNRGYAFKFENGRLQTWSRMIKNRDLFRFLNSDLFLVKAQNCAELLN